MVRPLPIGAAPPAGGWLPFCPCPDGGGGGGALAMVSITGKIMMRVRVIYLIALFILAFKPFLVL